MLFNILYYVNHTNLGIGDLFVTWTNVIPAVFCMLNTNLFSKFDYDLFRILKNVKFNPGVEIDFSRVRCIVHSANELKCGSYGKKGRLSRDQFHAPKTTQHNIPKYSSFKHARQHKIFMINIYYYYSFFEILYK